MPARTVDAVVPYCFAFAPIYTRRTTLTRKLPGLGCFVGHPRTARFSSELEGSFRGICSVFIYPELGTVTLLPASRAPQHDRDRVAHHLSVTVDNQDSAVRHFHG